MTRLGTLGFLRRTWVQLAGLAAAIALVAAIAVVAFRPSSGDGAKAMPHATATPRASATPDPRVEQVKAVAREFVRALWDSAKSGDAAVVERFVESGTQAAGNADVLATNSREGEDR